MTNRNNRTGLKWTATLKGMSITADEAVFSDSDYEGESASRNHIREYELSWGSSN